MSDFKLIAIRPRKGCSPKFLKVLKEDVIYKFYNDYIIETEGGVKDGVSIGEISKVVYISTVPKDLFKLKPSDISINISAVVGKNGSGKSSLIELFYVAVFNLSVMKGVIYDEISKQKKQLTVDAMEANINVDIVYQIDQYQFVLSLTNREIDLRKFDEGNLTDSQPHIELEDFFYSIAINYSHYALNSREIGHWIDYVFVKNDAYQTPLVLNPFRNEGNIDINTENYLTRSRLIANVLSENASLRVLAPTKEVLKVKFSIDQDKFKLTKREQKLYDNNIDFVIEEIIKVYVGKANLRYRNYFLFEETKKYIFKKLSRICLKYNHYRGYRKYFLSTSNLPGLSDYFIALKDDNSHITFKLRQAIYYLLYASCITKHQVGKILPVSSFAEKLVKLHKEKDLSLIEIIPPSFFIIELYFDSEENNFDRLSSGEKQKIYSISSLTYHLYNLDTVRKPKIPAKDTKKRIIKYQKANIILDEIELYYHPDLQRNFIKDLLDRLNSIKFQHIDGINLVFATHSPFILSDIPSQNILRLVEGKPEAYIASEKTFGANIHELLANDFFLGKRYIGELAHSTIVSLIETITSRKTIILSEKDQFLDMINLIGEPFIRTKLQEMVLEKLHETDVGKIEQKIRLKEKELGSLMEELKKAKE